MILLPMSSRTWCGISFSNRGKMNYNFYVYILTNKHRTVFYTGVTNNLFRRIIEHKIKINEGFTNDYNVNRLVHYELFFNIKDAIAREKQLKKRRRLWKMNLIEKNNANWDDLTEALGVTAKILDSAKTFFKKNACNEKCKRFGKP